MAVRSKEVSFLDVDFERLAEVKRSLEAARAKSSATKAVFIHNDKRFVKVFEELPVWEKTELILLKNQYMSHESARSVGQCPKREVTYLDRLSHLIDLPMFKDSSLTFPKVPAAVDMFKDFQSQELTFWRNVMRLEQPINFKNYAVIEGKRVGRKLGIPTGRIISQHICGKRLVKQLFDDAWRVFRTHQLQNDVESGSQKFDRADVQSYRECRFQSPISSKKPQYCAITRKQSYTLILKARSSTGR